MKQKLPSLLKKFSQTKDINKIPNSKGIYLIADCPLTKVNPSKWSCTLLSKGSSETLKNTITRVVTSTGLAKEYKALTYYFSVNLSQENFVDLLSQIDQVHIPDMK